MKKEKENNKNFNLRLNLGGIFLLGTFITMCAGFLMQIIKPYEFYIGWFIILFFIDDAK